MQSVQTFWTNFFQGEIDVEMFYLYSTLNFGILPVMVFQLEVYHKLDRLLTGITAQQKGTTARWYSNKISLYPNFITCVENMFVPNHFLKMNLFLIQDPAKFIHIY